MKSLRSMPVLLSAVLGIFMVMPIAVAAYASSHVIPVELPTFHSQAESQNVLLTPISTKKAQAIHDFKLAQI